MLLLFVYDFLLSDTTNGLQGSNLSYNLGVSIIFERLMGHFVFLFHSFAYLRQIFVDLYRYELPFMALGNIGLNPTK